MNLKILDILPPKGALHAPHFRSRYKDMPEGYTFHILVTGDTSLDGDTFSNATLHVQPQVLPWTWWMKTWRALGMMWRGIRIARREKVDVVISYDPLTLGVIGAVIKLCSGARLVVEVNGHIRDAESVRVAGGNAGWIKRTLFNLTGDFTFFVADVVKVLNQRQIEEWKGGLKRKPVVMFHDYVPTAEFELSKRDDGFLYCLGYPFHLKGVDLLLEAFSMIKDEFTDIRLIVMGHCKEPELSRWKALAADEPRVEFRKPIPYQEVAGYLGRCTALVVPSRSEGMGRVFIEAMASGKPCIATRVGGIPNVIEDGESGLLVNPEDHVDLADKLRLLLGDASLRERMGETGKRIADTRLSDRQYTANFMKTMELVMDETARTPGLNFNGFDMKAE